MFEFKVEDVMRAREIVQKLRIPEQFGIYDDDDSDVIEMLQYQLEDFLTEDFFVTAGISKAVINIDSFPFVIKIPFNGRFVSYYGGSDPDSDREYGVDYDFCEFDGADVQPDDYCADELDKTQWLESIGLGVFVPKMMCLCTIKGRDFYLQEKVIPICDNRTKLNPTPASKEKVECSFFRFETDWMATAIDIYGEKVWYSFVCACEDMEDIISDMHRGNYGLRLDGTPVLIDISGFRE